MTVAGGLAPLEWVALVLIAFAFAYGEGVRALARRWVPQMDRRARELGPAAALRHKLMAPLYAMSLVGASPRTLVRAWVGVVLIVAAVFIVRALPEPWRGIVDLSVAIALTIGFARIVLELRK